MNSNDIKSGCGRAGLYVHVPFCQSKCRYCGFYSEPIDNYNAESFVAAVLSEIDRYESCQLIGTVYIGGGSPSCLPAGLLLQLVKGITSRWNSFSEFTVEANPGQVNESALKQLREAGVNRLSIGGQSFDQGELDFLGRDHSVSCIERAVKMGRDAGFENINVDLIFAVPGSTLKSWRHSLDAAINLGVEHISAYSLTYENNTPLQKGIAAGTVLPVDEETDRAMYEMAIDELAKADLNQYEISNFAKRGCECMHNLTYWANQPYIGIGPAAGSYGQGRRTTNVADIKAYIKAVECNEDVIAQSQTPNRLETACETAVLNLRRRCGIDIKEFKERTGFNITKLFSEPISRYQQLGLIEATSRSIALTREALGIADSVLCDFSAI